MHVALQLNSQWLAYAGRRQLHPQTARGCRESENIKENELNRTFGFKAFNVISQKNYTALYITQHMVLSTQLPGSVSHRLFKGAN